MDPAPAARLAIWRWRTRACLVFGAALCLRASGVPEAMRSPADQLGLGLGLGLLALTFLLYFRYCNRCPRCGVSFSKAPAYASRETSGLELFERIERCPFCAEPLVAGADPPGP